MTEHYISLLIVFLLFVWLTLRGLELPWKAGKRQRRNWLSVDLVTMFQLSSLFAALLGLFQGAGRDGLLLAAGALLLVLVPTAIMIRWLIEDLMYALGRRSEVQTTFDRRELELLEAYLDAPPEPDPNRPAKKRKLRPFCPNVPEVRLSRYSLISRPLR